jgi:hypothetical protein
MLRLLVWPHSPSPERWIRQNLSYLASHIYETYPIRRFYPLLHGTQVNGSLARLTDLCGMPSIPAVDGTLADV